MLVSEPIQKVGPLPRSILNPSSLSRSRYLYTVLSDVSRCLVRAVRDLGGLAFRAFTAEKSWKFYFDCAYGNYCVNLGQNTVDKVN